MGDIGVDKWWAKIERHRFKGHSILEYPETSAMGPMTAPDVRGESSATTKEEQTVLEMKNSFGPEFRGLRADPITAVRRRSSEAQVRRRNRRDLYLKTLRVGFWEAFHALPTADELLWGPSETRLTVKRREENRALADFEPEITAFDEPVTNEHSWLGADIIMGYREQNA